MLTVIPPLLAFLQFAEQLYQPMPLMIWMAIIIEAAIESWPDMGILLAIQFLNASLSYYETTKAGDAVAALKASLKPVAYVKRDGKFSSMDAALLVPCLLYTSDAADDMQCVDLGGRRIIKKQKLTAW